MLRTLCTLNANGIRAAEKRGFSRWLGKQKPDVLCLQELRAWPDQVAEAVVSPAGYNSRWQCAEKKGYAGVAVYSHESVDAYRAGSGLGWGDAEGRVLRADFSGLSVVSLYIPSGSSSPARQAKKLEFIEHISDFTRKLARERRPVALCGDFNIAHTELDIHAPKRNVKNSGFLPEEREWFTRWLAQGWTDLVRAEHPDEPGLYSWWSNFGRARVEDRGWRIDYVLGNRSFTRRVTRAWIEKKAGLSDHAPVWVEFEDG